MSGHTSHNSGSPPTAHLRHPLENAFPILLMHRLLTLQTFETLEDGVESCGFVVMPSIDLAKILEILPESFGFQMFLVFFVDIIRQLFAHLINSEQR